MIIDKFANFKHFFLFPHLYFDYYMYLYQTDQFHFPYLNFQYLSQVVCIKQSNFYFLTYVFNTCLYYRQSNFYFLTQVFNTRLYYRHQTEQFLFPYLCFQYSSVVDRAISIALLMFSILVCIIDRAISISLLMFSILVCIRQSRLIGLGIRHVFLPQYKFITQGS